MVSESLKQRITDFLIKYPPFSYIEEEDLLKLASLSKIKVLNAKEFVFHEGENPPEEFYVINQGSIHLLIEETREIIEVLEEGDLFGIAALLANRLYIFSAQAYEDTILYVIPFHIFKEYIHKYPRVLRYFSSGFSPGMHHYKKKNISLQDQYLRSLSQHDEVLELKITKNVITCSPETEIRELAKIMKEKNIGSIIIINEKNYPVGIITDSDLRKKVATGDFPVTAKAKEIMTSPVFTMSPNINATEAIIQMMKKNIRHLVLTEDGTSNSPLYGIVSEHDVLVLHGNNPAVLVKEIQNTNETKRLSFIRNRAEQLLKDYIEQEVSIQFIANTITEINDALIEKAIELSIIKLEKEGLRKPDISFAWLSLGSEGRKEQMLRTDQDNAIIYEDPEDNKDLIADYFLKLGREVNQILMECGFKECPANIMARNPQWCQPISKWKEYFKKWIEIPDEKNVMHTTIFFDFRVAYGDENLAKELRQYIYNIKNSLFIGLLAKQAISNPPPLNFFRNLIVERSGEHKNEFDLKARCMMPIIDAARVLCLDYEILELQSTIERYNKLMELDSKNKEIYQEAIESFSIYLRFRTMQGLKHGDSGRYIKPEELSKLDRQLLRNTFHTIESIQKILSVKYQLDFIR
ncbi:MAG: hypothetical protein KatS3mg129_1322 [Leptospiraceae bacterium]|nr:MAG: hypothetical protein KatS3mg129_1322 [Leptospiraceae bacterium]